MRVKRDKTGQTPMWEGGVEKWKEACLSVLSLRRTAATIFMTLRLVPKGIMEASIAFSRLCLCIHQCNLALDHTLGEPIACKHNNIWDSAMLHGAFGSSRWCLKGVDLVWENASFWLEGNANLQLWKEDSRAALAVNAFVSVVQTRCEASCVLLPR